jgi:hypothetical protein
MGWLGRACLRVGRAQNQVQQQDQIQRQRAGVPAPHLLCRSSGTGSIVCDLPRTYVLGYCLPSLRDLVPILFGIPGLASGALFFRRFAACALWGWVRASTGNPNCEPHHEQLRNQNQSQKQRTGVSAPHRHQRLLAWGRSFRVLASWSQASR